MKKIAVLADPREGKSPVAFNPDRRSCMRSVQPAEPKEIYCGFITDAARVDRPAARNKALNGRTAVVRAKRYAPYYGCGARLLGIDFGDFLLG